MKADLKNKMKIVFYQWILPENGPTLQASTGAGAGGGTGFSERCEIKFSVLFDVRNMALFSMNCRYKEAKSATKGFVWKLFISLNSLKF